MWAPELIGISPTKAIRPLAPGKAAEAVDVQKPQIASTTDTTPPNRNGLRLLPTALTEHPATLEVSTCRAVALNLSRLPATETAARTRPQTPLCSQPSSSRWVAGRSGRNAGLEAGAASAGVKSAVNVQSALDLAVKTGQDVPVGLLLRSQAGEGAGVAEVVRPSGPGAIRLRRRAALTGGAVSAGTKRRRRPSHGEVDAPLPLSLKAEVIAYRRTLGGLGSSEVLI